MKRKLCTVVTNFCVFLFTENCALLFTDYTPEEISEFTKISANGNIPFFYILGIGGTQYSPKLLFAIPLGESIKSQMPIQSLNIYKKANPEKNFYFDTITKTLK